MEMKQFSEDSESSKIITTIPQVDLKRKASSEAGEDSCDHRQAQSKLKKSNHGELPTDIEYAILVKLPVKTLSRFKLACKSWYSLISSSQFRKDHYHRSEKNPSLLTMRSYEGYVKAHDFYFTLQFFVYNSANGSLVNSFRKSFLRLNELMQFVSIQSCLGLVCIASECGVVLVCNPSTGKIIELPRHCHTLCIGFGCRASTAEFKIVKFFDDGHRNYCSICDMATGNWREVMGPPYRPRQYSAPFIHGAVQMPHSRHAPDYPYISAFDLETEKYRSISLPKHKNFGRKKLVYLTELVGSLSLTFDFIYKGGQLEIWFLKDHNNGEWVKRHIIDLCKHSPPSPWHEGHISVRPVAMLGDKSIFLNVSGAELWCYDLEDRNLTRKTVNEIDDKLYHLESAIYVESFFGLGK